MRVKIESVGGFAGEAATITEYETGDLPERERVRVRDAVEDMDAAQAEGDVGEIGADLPGYRVTVGDRPPRVFMVFGDPGERLRGPLAVLLRGSTPPA